MLNKKINVRNICTFDLKVKIDKKCYCKDIKSSIENQFKML